MRLRVTILVEFGRTVRCSRGNPLFAWVGAPGCPQPLKVRRFYTTSPRRAGHARIFRWLVMHLYEQILIKREDSAERAQEFV